MSFLVSYIRELIIIKELLNKLFLIITFNFRALKAVLYIILRAFYIILSFFIISRYFRPRY